MTTRMASFVFCDLVGSTALHSRLGDDAADQLRRRIHTALRDAVRAHGGTEVKNLGDGIMAGFEFCLDGASSEATEDIARCFERVVDASENFRIS